MLTCKGTANLLFWLNVKKGSAAAFWELRKGSKALQNGPQKDYAGKSVCNRDCYTTLMLTRKIP